MTRLAPIGPVSRLLLRIAGRGGVRAGASAGGASDRELRSPEQRLLDVVARYGRIGASKRADSGQTSSATAAGVRTVAPTEPSGEFAPTWVRRLAVPSSAPDEPAASPASARPRSPRRPRRP